MVNVAYYQNPNRKANFEWANRFLSVHISLSWAKSEKVNERIQFLFLFISKKLGFRLLWWVSNLVFVLNIHQKWFVFIEWIYWFTWTMNNKFESVWMNFTFTWISGISLGNLLLFILLSYLIKFKPYVWYNHFWILSTFKLLNNKTHSC